VPISADIGLQWAGDVNMAESYHCEERGFWWALEGAQSQSSKKGAVPP
jgi:hypothetical protein